MPPAPTPGPPAGKPLLRALRGERVDPPPVWLMRQAGRYLPEYRALRDRAADFMALCGAPELAAEITLQPVRRFGLDAAIVFSDILVAPHAMGRTVRFSEGAGPLLEPLAGAGDIDALDAERAVDGNRALLETLALTRRALDADTALIGFAGAPFTLAAYMIDGRGGGAFPRTRALMTDDPALLDRLVAVLVRAVSALLIAQIDAGAEAVQIFDSWAGLLEDDGSFARWATAPAAAIAAEVHDARPGAPAIGFPRAAGRRFAAFAEGSGVDALQVDEMTPLAAMAALQRRAPVQGNLDPGVLRAGGEALDGAVRATVAALGGGPHVFNLGHGVIRDTPPENVARLVAAVRGGPP